MGTTQKPEDLEKNKKTSTVSGGGELKVTGYKTPTTVQEAEQPAVSARTTALQEYLKKTVGGTPTESDLLKSVREQLMNRTGFSYDHNNDPSFQQYFDNAKRSGRLAMQDTMGQAAALTGGYANSWAQTAGQTTLNDYLQDANQMIPEFEQLARSRYDAETAALTDKYALLKGEYDDELAEYNSKYDIAREDWYKEQEKMASEKEYEDEKKMREIELLLAMGDYNALDKMGYNTSSLRAQAAAEATAKVKDEEEDPVALWNYSKTSEKDSNKNEYYIYNSSDGKQKKVALGVNPYNGEINKDVLGKDGKVDPNKLFMNKDGVYSNTYQPNNIGGDPLEKTGKRYNMNGRDQAIWKTSDGTEWVWDGTQNKYLKIDWED